MQDKTTEQNAKKKTLAVVFAAGIVFMLAASWYATQNVAELCGYSPLLGFNISHIYLPWHYFIWCHTPEIAEAIPQILEGQERWFYLAVLPLAPIGYLVQKSLIVNISHGSAAWATKKEIDDSGLGLYEKKTVKYKWLGLIPRTKEVYTFKNSGVVIGVNPYTDRIMLDDDPTHVLLMAPTRSGKGVNTIIPTGLIWQHSIFFFDVKKELWQATASYRKKHFKQKVMKFDPLCADGSSARWNPLAEVDFQTDREINDVSTIVEIMVRPDGEQKGGDNFWPDSAAALLKGVILHLLYSHYQEGKPLPCPTDIMSFLSSPDKNTQTLFTDMKNYPHISPEEFMSDHNVLYEIYGEYIRDWRAINKNLASWQKVSGTIYPPVHNIREVREAIQRYRDDYKKDIDWKSPQWAILLSHPKVAESAAVMLKGAEQTSESVMQTAQTALALYQNPVVQKNTAVSDFTVRDLLDPSQAVSMYLCMQMDDLATVKPLSRLFINTILSKLIRDMKFSKNQSAKGAGKQRLLLMLDEFPQLGNMNKVEQALAVCAGYGIKMCIVTQDINQLNTAYTKENSIASNCKLRVFFAPMITSRQKHFGYARKAY
ncbi:MAG: type IV secretory system conjugative DNA transfer family protein [Schwartzia sp.]|nr:type IV secretory system conjugative DNA transfer family protein [Schwartzia sp. (in: firmicutes)]